MAPAYSEELFVCPLFQMFLAPCLGGDLHYNR